MRTAVRLVTASTVIVSSLALQGAVAGHQALPAVVRPCLAEDGSGPGVACFWDASKRGNGLGRSYVITRNGSVHYLGRR